MIPARLYERPVLRALERAWRVRLRARRLSAGPRARTPLDGPLVKMVLSLVAARLLLPGGEGGLFLLTVLFTLIAMTRLTEPACLAEAASALVGLPGGFEYGAIGARRRFRFWIGIEALLICGYAGFTAADRGSPWAWAAISALPVIGFSAAGLAALVSGRLPKRAVGWSVVAVLTLAVGGQWLPDETAPRFWGALALAGRLLPSGWLAAALAAALDGRTVIALAWFVPAIGLAIASPRLLNGALARHWDNLERDYAARSAGRGASAALAETGLDEDPEGEDDFPAESSSESDQAARTRLLDADATRAELTAALRSGRAVAIPETPPDLSAQVVARATPAAERETLHWMLAGRAEFVSDKSLRFATLVAAALYAISFLPLGASYPGVLAGLSFLSLGSLFFGAAIPFNRASLAAWLPTPQRRWQRLRLRRAGATALCTAPALILALQSLARVIARERLNGTPPPWSWPAVLTLAAAPGWLLASGLMSLPATTPGLGWRARFRGACEWLALLALLLALVVATGTLYFADGLAWRLLSLCVAWFTGWGLARLGHARWASGRSDCRISG